MRNSLLLVGTVIVSLAALTWAQDKKPAPKVFPKAARATAPAAAPVSAAAPAAPAAKISADEAAIRKSAEDFAKAYSAGDAAGVAALFAPDAEYVDEAGDVYLGRDAIQAILTSFFAENPGCKLQGSIASIRFVGPSTAIEDGSTTVTRPGSAAPLTSAYTAVHAKTDGKWLVASVRDHEAPQDENSHYEHLKQLAWMIGDWIDEGDGSVIAYTCRWGDKKNSLIRDFTIKMAGRDVMTGTQRIGWDPLAKSLRTWTFDSEGSFGDGLWHRDGNAWTLTQTGVTAKGQAASGASIFTYVNPHTMTWQAVDRIVGGERVPDTDVITVVRRPPSPPESRKASPAESQKVPAGK